MNNIEITKIDYDLLAQKYPNTLKKVIKKINNGYPIQYLIGYVDFYDCKILVNKNVLIPRFETESLVEKTIKLINKYFYNPIIADLGTGSGCIAIKLKRTFPNSKIFAYDISQKALNIAMKNAKINNVYINFKKSNILKFQSSEIDVVISNPPYIAYNEKIMFSVKKYEPKKALYAKENGIYFYHQIIKNFSINKNKKILLAFEIGENQSEKLIKIANDYFPNSNIYVENDLVGKPRFLFILNKMNK